MKTVVIGLDGATFDIINPMVEGGRLSAIARLMREGSHAPLRSTLLPNSFPGWSSCVTGTSEGMHGIFSPFIKEPSRYTVRAMSGRDIETRRVWDFVSENRGRSVVINVPTAYPPEPLNGEMVTGMLTPGLESEFTYPDSLKGDILARFPGYVIEPARNPDKRARAEEFRHATSMHEQVTDYLMSRGEWDFLMVVFSVLDRAQHDFWADMDSTHPRHDPRAPREFGSFIRETYSQLDEAIGRLVGKLPAQTRVLIVSDHGFCSELYEVRVNEALAEAGLLTFKSSALRRSRAGLRSLKEKISRRLLNNGSEGNVLDKKVAYGSAFLDEIDWAKTRAYFAQDKGVWVNLRGREREGSVDESAFDDTIEEARRALARVTSPFDGEKVFEKVMRRDEAFNGRFSRRLPDLVMIPRSDNYVYNERPSYGQTVVEADSTTGTHSRDGILIAWGSGIKAGATFNLQPNLRDIGPTALASLGLPLTRDMDGRCLDEMFVEPPAISLEGSSYRHSGEDKTESVYEGNEEAEIRERLRALGYIE
jgi:predicted AlkP superfamily phosphohydrolase/phosphomutase